MIPGYLLALARRAINDQTAEKFVNIANYAIAGIYIFIKTINIYVSCVLCCTTSVLISPPRRTRINNHKLLLI